MDAGSRSLITSLLAFAVVLASSSCTSTPAPPVNRAEPERPSATSPPPTSSFGDGEVKWTEDQCMKLINVSLEPTNVKVLLRRAGSQTHWSPDEDAALTDVAKRATGASAVIVQCVDAYGPLPEGDAALAFHASDLHAIEQVTGGKVLLKMPIIGMETVLESYPGSCFTDMAQTFVDTQGATFDVKAIVSDCNL